MREARGWSQTELAENLAKHGFEYHQTTIGKLESGSRPLRIGELFAMAHVFEVSAIDLVKATLPGPSTDDAEFELPQLEREAEVARTNFMESVQSALADYTRAQQAIVTRRIAVTGGNG